MTQTGPVSGGVEVMPTLAGDGPVIRAGDENAPPLFLPDVDPPEKIGALAGEYIGLFIVGGLVLGLAAGALLPRRPVSKLGGGVSKGLGALAAVAGEAGLAMVEQVRTHGGELREAGSGHARGLNERIGVGVNLASARIRREGDRLAALSDRMQPRLKDGERKLLSTARRLSALVDLLIARARR